MLYFKTTLISITVCTFLLVSGASAKNVIETNESKEQASATSNPNKGGLGVEPFSDPHCQRPTLSGWHRTKWAHVGSWYRPKIEISGWTTTKITCPSSRYSPIVKLDVNMTIIDRAAGVVLKVRNSQTGAITSMSGYAKKRYGRSRLRKVKCGIAHHKVTFGTYVSRRITRTGVASFCAKY